MWDFKNQLFSKIHFLVHWMFWFSVVTEPNMGERELQATPPQKQQYEFHDVIIWKLTNELKPLNKIFYLQVLIFNLSKAIPNAVWTN